MFRYADADGWMSGAVRGAAPWVPFPKARKRQAGPGIAHSGVTRCHPDSHTYTNPPNKSLLLLFGHTRELGRPSPPATSLLLPFTPARQRIHTANMARALGLMLLLVAGAAVAASAQSLPDKEKCRATATSQSSNIQTLAPCASGPSVSKQPIAGAEAASECLGPLSHAAARDCCAHSKRKQAR